MKFLIWLHTLLIRFCWWLVLLVPRSLWAFARVVLAMLGEEFQRYAGLAVSGVMIFLAGKVTLAYSPDQFKRPLVMTVLLLVCIWAVAVRRAVHYTSHNSLRMVRQRQAFRDLAGDVGTIRKRMGDGLARATWGTPAQGAFRSNRQRVHRETEQEARKRDEAAADDARRQELADLEPSPY
jgi:hypothetical protein